MAGRTPRETVQLLENAFNNADADAAIALYEKGARLVAEPGMVTTNRDELEKATRQFSAMEGKLTTHSFEIIEAGDLALYTSNWSFEGKAPDGTEIKQGGISTDILRRNEAGQWLIAIDNPFGNAILQTATIT